MQDQDKTVAEIERRLQHLRSLPETPLRRRERLSLERALENLASRPAASSRGSGTTRRRTEYAATRETEEKPRSRTRRVERRDGRRRVVVRSHQKLLSDEEIEAQKREEERQRKQRQSDIRSMLGGTYRG